MAITDFDCDVGVGVDDAPKTVARGWKLEALSSRVSCYCRPSLMEIPTREQLLGLLARMAGAGWRMREAGGGNGRGLGDASHIA